MSANLSAGVEVILDTNGRQTVHVITARRIGASGVQYRLLPAIDVEWVDAKRVRKAKGFGSDADRSHSPFEVAE